MFAFIMRLRSYFSESKKKQNLKTDLEILSLSGKSNLTETSIIPDRVKEQIESSYNQELRGNNEISNFITGIIVFIGLDYGQLTHLRTLTLILIRGPS